MTPIAEDTMAKTVNLDALIMREDMGGGRNKPMVHIQSLRHADLILGNMTYSVLRKPDFQRATSYWTPEKVRDMIVAFVEGDFVPAVILWRSQSNDLFVIDGSHRLSSLIAWINDDYGNGQISRQAFTHVSEQQQEIHSKTRELVIEAVGPYDMLSKALVLTNLPEKYVENGKKLVHAGIRVQDLENTDAGKAERSFFKINEQGVPLSETEKLMLHSRFCPNAIAARAISQRGTGYPHWGNFSPEKRATIETLAKEVYSLLFEPPLPAGTIKTSNLPIAGSYTISDLGLVFNSINLSNKSGDAFPNSREEAEAQIGIDQDGTRTIEYLNRTKGLASLLSNRMNTDFMKSLDLHPFVYFYSEQGRHQPSLFLATVELMRDYEEKNLLLEFTKVRSVFEDFLVNHRFLIPQIFRRARGDIKAVHRLKEYLAFVLNEFRRGKKEAEILTAVSHAFGLQPVTDEEDRGGKRLTPRKKSQRFVIDDLKTTKRCYLCKARVPDHCISFDHVEDKKNGGLGTVANTDLTHHYCNGSKDLIAQKSGHKK